jgi:hypothetical protein
MLLSGGTLCSKQSMMRRYCKWIEAMKGVAGALELDWDFADIHG